MNDSIYQPAQWRVAPLLVLRRMLGTVKVRGRFRVGNLVAHLMLPNQMCVLPNKLGGNMVFDLQNIHEVSMFYDLFAEDLTAVLKHTLRAGDTFIDCGANVGYFSFLAAQMIGPQGKVVAIDANPYCAGRIAASRDVDAYPHVEIIEAAVSGQRGEMKFNIATDPMYSSVSDLNETSFAKVKQEISVPVVTLDSLLQEQTLTAPGAVRLVKVDVEGAEIDLLKGAKETLKNEVVDFYYIELHDQQLRAKGQSIEEVAELLSDFGYANVYEPSLPSVVYQSGRSLAVDGPFWEAAPAATS